MYIYRYSWSQLVEQASIQFDILDIPNLMIKCIITAQPRMAELLFHVGDLEWSQLPGDCAGWSTCSGQRSGLGWAVLVISSSSSLPVSQFTWCPWPCWCYRCPVWLLLTGTRMWLQADLSASERLRGGCLLATEDAALADWRHTECSGSSLVSVCQSHSPHHHSLPLSFSSLFRQLVFPCPPVRVIMTDRQPPQPD